MVKNQAAAGATPNKPPASSSRPNGSSSAHRPLANGLANTANGNNATHSRSASGVSAPSWRGPGLDTTKSAPNADPFKHSAIVANGAPKVNGGVPVAQPAQRPNAITFLNKDSESDEGPSNPVIVSTPASTTTAMPEGDSSKGKAKAVQDPVGTRGPNFSPTRKVRFTTDVGPDATFLGGHYIKVSFKCGRKEVTPIMEALCNEFGWDSKVNGSSSKEAPESPHSRPVVALYCFDDIRDAAQAKWEVSVIDSKCETEYVSQSDYAAATVHHGTAMATAPYDGQVIFAAQFEGDSVTSKQTGLYDEVRSLAGKYGELLEMSESKVSHGAWEFRAEYYKISAAKKAVEDLTEATPASIQGWSVFARDFANLHALSHKSVHDGQAAPGQYATSRTGRTIWGFDGDGNTVLRPGPVRVPKARLPAVESQAVVRGNSTPEVPPTEYFGAIYASQPRSQSWNGPATMGFDPMSGTINQNHASEGHQAVEIDRIRRGHDVRTTLMLRNLPNCINAAYLKEKILDIATKNKYDFSYLRYDFEKGLNVGYAFVNFTDPAHIITFVEHWDQAIWYPLLHINNGTRPRLAEIAYATTQGIECSIAKFRNSSVMLEAPPYRPKLWYTAETAPDPSMIGKERPFPSSDNQAKLQRSLDNAGQVGLFAPARRNDGRSGRGGRARQQRSQFDRGTLAQIQEDAIMNNFGGQIMYPGQLQGHMMYNFMNGSMFTPAPPNFPGAYNNVHPFGYEQLPANSEGLLMPNGAPFLPGPFNLSFINPFNMPSAFPNGGNATNHGGAVQSPTSVGPSNHHHPRFSNGRVLHAQNDTGYVSPRAASNGNHNGEGSGRNGQYSPPHYQ